MNEVSTQPETTPRNIRWVLFGVMLAMMLGMLDNMVVGTAMPTIIGELGGREHLSWVVSAYGLAAAASTPIWGKLGDLYGRKNIYLTSIVIFLVGSVLSGTSTTMNELIGFRALQGIGAGGLAVGAMAITGELVSPRERGKYQGMMATVMAVATIGGPLLGGILTEHLGWRWIFYVNLPLGIIALVWCQSTLHLSARRPNARIDYLGATLLTVSIAALMLATTWGGTQYGWSSPRVLASLAITVIAMAAFLFSQTRAAEPIVPLGLFGNRNFSLASGLAVVVGVVMFGAVTFMPLFQQTVQGASAINSGILLLPMMIPIVLVSQIVGRVMAKTGRYKLFPVLGGASLVIGSFLLSTMDASTDRVTAGLYMALVGIGLGFLMQMTMVIAQNSVEMKDIGAASGTATLLRTLGGSIGVALFGALLNRAIISGIAGSAEDTSIVRPGSQPNPTDLAPLSAELKSAYLNGLASGIHNIFLCIAALSAVGFLVSWFILEVPLRKQGGPAPSKQFASDSHRDEPSVGPTRG